MRVYRSRPEPDLSLAKVAAGLERANSQRRRALGDVIDLWNELAPERVREFAKIDSLAQGTLTLAVAGSSASYELSRVLRDGLERDLTVRMPTRIRRIKVRVSSEGGSEGTSAAVSDAVRGGVSGARGKAGG